jgi:predicted nucleotidyltransferase
MTSATANPNADQLEEYRRSYWQRKEEKQKQLMALIKEARAVALLAAQLLKSQFGVTRVMMFGSLTRPSLFHFNSDIDLAVWGLPEKEYYRAVGILQSLHPKFAVDVVRFEEVSPALQAMILNEGEDL